MRYAYFALLLGTLLSSCTNIPIKPPPNTPCVPVPLALAPLPVEIQESRVDDLMREYEQLSQLPVSALVVEYQHASQVFLQTGNNLERVRMAMLLALPTSPFHDTTAALSLLNSYPKDVKVAPSVLSDFAHFLATLLVEQQRSTTALLDLKQKLKEGQKRTDDLQNKIDAIKSMEMNPINVSKP